MIMIWRLLVYGGPMRWNHSHFALSLDTQSDDAQSHVKFSALRRITGLTIRFDDCTSF